MANKPAFKYEQVDRGKIFQVCKALGIDVWQVRSIHIEADEIELEIFEFNDQGNRFFANPDKPEEGYKKYNVTLQVV